MSNKGTNLVTVDTDEYRDMLKKVYTHDSGVMEIKAQAEYEGSKKVARNLKTALHNQCGEAVDELEELLHAVKFRIPEEAKTSTRDLLIEIGTEKKSYHTEAADLVHEFETKLHRFDGNADKIKEVIELEKETLYDFERRHHASLEDIGKRFVNRGAHHLSQIFLSYWKDHDRICTSVYNTMVDLDKAIDKEIGRIPLDTLVEYRRELTTESFIHGGIVPHFHMPAFITSHSFLKCPEFDDHWWTFRLSKENWKEAHEMWPPKPGKYEGALERLNPRMQTWTPGWCAIDEDKFYWYNRRQALTKDMRGKTQKLLKACELCYINCVFLSGRDRDEGKFRDIVLMTEQRSYMLRAKTNADAVAWLEQIVSARKHALGLEHEEDKYHRLYSRRLEPRDGTIHVHDDLEAALAVEKEIQEGWTGVAVQDGAKQGKKALQAGVKALRTTKKMVGMKADPMMASSLDAHSGYTKTI